MHATCIIQFHSNSTISVVTDVPDTRLDGVALLSFSQNDQAALVAARSIAEAAFDAAEAGQDDATQLAAALAAANAKLAAAGLATVPDPTL